MRTTKNVIGAAIFALLLGVGMASTAHAVNDDLSLNAKQQGIIPIAAFTASGDMERLKSALSSGLEAALTVNEIEEILVQMYAYAGFPRSLNGIFAFMEVLEERKAQGIDDEVGRDASPVPDALNKDEYGAKVRASLAGLDDIPPPSAWQQFSPVIDTFLKEHLFADIFARDVLDFQSRELGNRGRPRKHERHGRPAPLPFRRGDEHGSDRSTDEGFHRRAEIRSRGPGSRGCLGDINRRFEHPRQIASVATDGTRKRGLEPRSRPTSRRELPIVSTR